MKKFIFIIVLSMTIMSSFALELPEIFSDNMMLQQSTEAKVWGWAAPNSKVEISVSWSQKKYQAKANNTNGKWNIKIETPKGGYSSHFITVKGDEETIKINNILIGEVWFCSGQSNMEMPLGGFWNCPVEGANEAIAQSGKYKKSIRCITIEHTDALTPQDKTRGTWKTCEPENTPGFSACGYFF